MQVMAMMVIQPADTTTLLTLRIRPRVALAEGRTHHGVARCELSDEDIAQIPAELRDELAQWIERQHAEDAPTPLDLARPDIGIDGIVSALRRERELRTEHAVREWLSCRYEGWFDEDGRPSAEIEALREHPRIARALELHRVEMKARARAQNGLSQYVMAHRLPELLRAAQEGYDVSARALDHYAAQVAKFASDAIVLVEGTPEYDNGRFEERRSPSAHAFEVVDRVTMHVAKTPKPDGVDAVVDRVMVYRPGVLRRADDSERWAAGERVTVVRVQIGAPGCRERIVVFRAEADGRSDAKRS
jgi:hypothetical protein